MLDLTLVETEFAAWVQLEMNRRSWDQADLARASGMTPQQISRVMQGTRGFGLSFIHGVAQAFRVPVETVMRKAGWLPPAGELMPEVRAWNERLMFLNEERFLPISPDTRAVIWKYLNKERGDEPVTSPLFAMMDGRPMSRVALLQLLRRLGERAGVRDVHPHRFRHSFAIQFLRNGGDVYALQAALGHTTLEMVRRYLQLAQTDIERAHETASPVAKWRLR